MGKQTLVEVFSRSNCPLCDEALQVVRSAQSRVAFELRVVDILSDQTLYEQYRYDVPVVRINGLQRFVHRVSREDLEALL